MLGANTFERHRGSASSRIRARGSAISRGGSMASAMTATRLPLTSARAGSLSTDGVGSSSRMADNLTTVSATSAGSGSGSTNGATDVTITNVYDLCKRVLGQLKGIDG